MKLCYKLADTEKNVSTILEFTKSGVSDFWSMPFFHFYPDIDKTKYKLMSDEKKIVFLQKYFGELKSKNELLLVDKINAYNTYWQRHENEIISKLQNIFQIDLSKLFNDLVCYTSFCPICPRYLAEHSFNNFYLESEKGALGTSMHEIIHFVWFYVWNDFFGDSYAEYEAPNLKWILSEMVVEPIMRYDDLGAINPYFTSKSCVYPYFYTLKIDDEPILDKLYKMLTSMPIKMFMEQSYELCIKHEQSIRKHIQSNEN